MAITKEDITKDLEKLIRSYVQYDEENETYPMEKLPEQTLLQLDMRFCQLIDKWLLTDGPKKENIEQNYKQISRIVHNDKKPQWTAELKWLDQQLAADANDAICFKTLSDRYERLTAPENFAKDEFMNVSPNENWEQKFQRKKANANTYTARYMYHSFSKLIQESRSYRTETEKVDGMKSLLNTLPWALSGYGGLLLAPELFAIYSTCFLVKQGGKALKQQESEELQLFGQTLKELGGITTMVTSTVLARTMQLVFKVSATSVSGAAKVGKFLLGGKSSKSRHSGFSYSSSTSSEGGASSSSSSAPPGFFLPAPPTTDGGELETVHDFMQQLILAANSTQGAQLQTPELKIVIAPLERYLYLNKQQFGRQLRAGWAKGEAIKAALLRIRTVDSQGKTKEEKLAEAKKEVEALKGNKDVYSKTAKKAINRAGDTLGMLSTLFLPSAEDLQAGASNLLTNTQ